MAESKKTDKPATPATPATPAGKKKQPELKGMPPKTQLEKDTEAVVEKWEDLQKKKAALTEAKKLLLATMKKTNRFVASALDSNGIKRKIEYKETEGINITKMSGEDD